MDCYPYYADRTEENSSHKKYTDVNTNNTDELPQIKYYRLDW